MCIITFIDLYMAATNFVVKSQVSVTYISHSKKLYLSLEFAFSYVGIHNNSCTFDLSVGNGTFFYMAIIPDLCALNFPNLHTSSV